MEALFSLFGLLNGCVALLCAFQQLIEWLKNFAAPGMKRRYKLIIPRYLRRSLTVTGNGILTERIDAIVNGFIPSAVTV